MAGSNSEPWVAIYTYLVAGCELGLCMLCVTATCLGCELGSTVVQNSVMHHVYLGDCHMVVSWKAPNMLVSNRILDSDPVYAYLWVTATCLLVVSLEAPNMLSFKQNFGLLTLYVPIS